MKTQLMEIIEEKTSSLGQDELSKKAIFDILPENVKIKSISGNKDIIKFETIDGKGNGYFLKIDVSDEKESVSVHSRIKNENNESVYMREEINAAGDDINYIYASKIVNSCNQVLYVASKAELYETNIKTGLIPKVVNFDIRLADSDIMPLSVISKSEDFSSLSKNSEDEFYTKTRATIVNETATTDNIRYYAYRNINTNNMDMSFVYTPTDYKGMVNNLWHSIYKTTKIVPLVLNAVVPNTFGKELVETIGNIENKTDSVIGNSKKNIAVKSK